MYSSSTSHSEKQSSSLRIASSNNCDGVSPSSFYNFCAEGEHNREAAFRPCFASGPSRTEDTFMWSSSLNADAAVGSGINGYDENLANSGSSGVLIDSKQCEKWNANHVLRSTVNPTHSFDLFDVPFIDNNGRNDVLPPIQPFDSGNNGVYFGNQYVPDFDLGTPNVEENDTYTDQSTIDDDFIWKAGFCQRLNDQRYISTTGYAAEADILSSQMPSTSEASHVDRQRTQWPLGQREDSMIDNDESENENENVTSPRKKRYSKKPLPSKNLYTIHNGKYICRYKGPAKPEGCSIKSANLRYLYRHLRIHALKEREMCITAEERVACNGMPEELLYIDVCCPFKKVADQRKCRFFRETGTIWRVGALDRWESVMARHKAEYHDTGDEQ